MLFNETRRSEESGSEGQTGAAGHSHSNQEGRAGCGEGLAAFRTTMARAQTLTRALLLTRCICCHITSTRDRRDHGKCLLTAPLRRSEPRRRANKKKKKEARHDRARQRRSDTDLKDGCFLKRHVCL